MTDDRDARFSRVFDRAVMACAAAQRLAARCRDAQARARATRASARRLGALAAETRDAWVGSDLVFSAMRREVEAVAHSLRDAGVACDQAGATVRAHMRFVLYDGGMAEDDAESLIDRASDWVDLAYEAA